MKLQLTVLTPGKGEGKSIPITLAQFLIGRDPQCHLRPASPVISKRHCAVLVRDGKVFVRDFDSTNGTFVNDAPIKGEVELRDKDQLKVGPLLFAVGIEANAATPVDKQTPIPPTKTPVPPTKAPGAASKTPVPPTKAPPVPARAAGPRSDDDDIAEMLLGLGDEGSGGAAGAAGGDSVPDGSTVMDIPAPFAPGDPNAPKAGDDKKAPTKAGTGNTSTAAKAILEKYMRRPRG